MTRGFDERSRCRGKVVEKDVARRFRAHCFRVGFARAIPDDFEPLLAAHDGAHVLIPKHVMRCPTAFPGTGSLERKSTW